jgi:hypothetical protein
MERGTGMKKIHETILRYSKWALIPDLVDQSIFFINEGKLEEVVVYRHPNQNEILRTRHFTNHRRELGMRGLKIQPGVP